MSVRHSVFAVLSASPSESWKYFHDEKPRNQTLLNRCRPWYRGKA